MLRNVLRSIFFSYFCHAEGRELCRDATSERRQTLMTRMFGLSVQLSNFTILKVPIYSKVYRAFFLHYFCFINPLIFLIMPKIRLSALASDIKGKSGGSVFSTNQGGTYFRNNPSGGGKKSERWNLKKSQFAYVSGLWRTLSEEQQDAWTDARSNFPTTNAFGEPRFPSGFELFMRLNAVLHVCNLPTLSVPPTPESFPTLEDVSWFTPSVFCFVPQLTSVVGQLGNDIGNQYIHINKIDTEISPENGRSYFFKFRLLRELRVPMSPAPTFQLLHIGAIDGNHFSISYVQNLSSRGSIFVVFDNGLTTFSAEYIVEKNLYNSFHSLSFFSGVSNFSEHELRLDNVLLTPLSAPSASYDTIAFDEEIYFNSPAENSFSPFQVVDFRGFTDNCSAETWSKICNGYEAPASFLWFGLNSYNDGEESNSASNADGAKSAYFAESNSPFYLIPSGLTFTPYILIEFPNPLSSAFLLQLYATPCLSAGKRADQSRNRLISLIDLQDLESYNASSDWASAYGGASNDGYIQISARLVNPSTGQAVDVPIPSNGKRVVRFKAGADLAGKV